MLVSQITAASQASNFALRASSTSLLARAGRRTSGNQQQQTRGFRFGLWSSYLDPAFQKEVRRRHKILKHKYAEVLSRQSAWDRQQPTRQPHWSFKSFMYSAWRGHDPRPGGRWVNMDELNNTSNSENPQRSINIEGFDRLFGRHNARVIEDFIRQSRGVFGRGWNADGSSSFSTTAVHNGLFKARKAPEKEQKEDVESPPEMEYDIDPISNRRVYRRQEEQATQTQIPVKTFKGYRSQFSDFKPPNSESLEGELEQYKPVMYNEPDGRPSVKPDPVKEALEKYNRRHKYEPVMFNEPDGKLPKTDPDQENLTYYDAQNPSYNQPKLVNDLDRKPPGKPDLLNEDQRDYDQKQSSTNPVRFNESNRRLPERFNLDKEALKYYEDRHPSHDKPVFLHEPDGKLPEKSDLVAESLKDYDGRITYDEPFVFNEPGGQLSKQPDSVSEALKDYDRTHEYQPFFYNHPDGHGAQKADENYMSDNNGDNISSSSRQWSTWALETEKQDDIDLLRASDVRASSGIIKGSKKETEFEKRSRRSDLERDFNKPERSQGRSEDEIAAHRKVNDSRKLAEELEIERSELLNHTSHARGRVNARIAELEAEASADAATKSAEIKLTGNYVRDFPEEFKASWTRQGSTTQDILVPKSAAGSERSDQYENLAQAAEQNTAAQISSQEWQSPSSKSSRLETSLDRKHKDEDNFQTEVDPYSKRSQGLETCYAEEKALEGGDKPLFISSYGCGREEGRTQTEKNKEKKHQKELVREIRGIYEDKYGTIDCKHRQVPEENAVPVDSSSAAKIEHDMKIQEPTVYKILAYDPTMQEINIASTTSIVPDLSSPLTPAEVLLRLSQPAKFFAHFAPLQAQGYEIASGSGDVLVFRKVRDGPPPPPASIAKPNLSKPEASKPLRQDSTRISSHTHRGKPINPIDGMKYSPTPAAANFASPTGFVGEPVSLEDLEPPFKSNIDVRREEEVFSGRNTGWHEGKQRKPRKLAKKLAIGAVWVAGCSYAIGVVAEFFRTGGSDGTGAVGF